MRETLARFGILSYRLFYFERNESGDFRRLPNTRRRRWSPPPRTTCRRWRDSGSTRISRRGIGWACWTRPAIGRSSRTRAREKQKMLDLLFAAGPAAGRIPVPRRRSSRADRRVAQRRDRIPGVHAIQAAAGQSGGPDQGVPQQNLAGHDLAVSELGPQDAIHGGATLDAEKARGFHRHVPPLADPDRRVAEAAAPGHGSASL